MFVSAKRIQARFERSPLAYRFLAGAWWSVVGSVLTNFLTLATMMYIARTLGKETYGQFIIIQSTLTMIGVFSGVGIGTTATRYVAQLKLSDRLRLGRILVLAERTVLVFGIAAALILMLASSSIAGGFLHAPNIGAPLAIAAASVLFSALDSYQKSVLIGGEAMREFAIGSIIGAVISVPLLLIASKQYGLNGVAGALVALTFIQFLISRRQMSRVLVKLQISRPRSGAGEEWRVLRDFTLPALFGGILVAPAHWISQTILTSSPSGYAELAVLGVAMQWFNVMIFLPSLAGRVVLPILTEHFVDGQHFQSAKIIKLAMVSNIIVAAPVALIVAFASPYIMATYGTDFRNGTAALALIGLVAVMYVAALPAGQILAAADRMWLAASMNFGWAVIYLGCAYMLSGYGALGIVASMGIAYFFHSIWTGVYTVRHLSLLRLNAHG